jgi:hypothetical protein
LSSSSFPATTVPFGSGTAQVTNFSPSQISVNAGDIAPSVSAGSDFSINANSNLVLHAAGSSPAGNALTYSWDINGDDTFGDATGATVTLTPAQLKALGVTSSTTSLTISVIASDGHGQTTTSAPITVTINPTAAVTQKISGPTTIQEGATYTLKLTGKAPTGQTVTSWNINWGDGSTDSISSNPTSATHTYAAGPNNYTISAIVGISGSDSVFSNTVNVAVSHVAPKPVISGTSTIAEGSTYTLNLSAPEAMPASHTVSSWTINWGDGSKQVVPGTSSSVTHTYSTGPNNFTITAKATDDVSTYKSNSLAVKVQHVAPSVTISGDSSITEGNTYTLTIDASEIANHKISSFTINWGDGNSKVVHVTPSMSVTGLEVTHVFVAKAHSPTISIKATDNVGTYAGTNTIPLTVIHQAPNLNVIGSSTGTVNTNYVLNLSAVEPAAHHTITSWTISWGDGTTTTVTGNPTSVKHKYTSASPSGHPYVITATATDDVGGPYDATAEQDVTIS